ncbi:MULTISPECIES: GntR family transcriptional regulator [unclassified Rhizobium]|jgi:DNA-binding GntR family transcriptional regulator|uniref:GntR family transcriptional regulator n=1 Tax=unclassified Rhizobium TaxID=2613769 RepID=UPI000649022C|nr:MULTISPECIES: GntR family transcriptional regulator [unclassified Rhizobium]MBN8953584.1 GntR family transcriptional regulator [Rhizobium tropici]OJY79034.1 MAG: GntR family transcriptional regulator [Rhizobium sp. 60-20]RKD67764.1 DNA-binding GntR family transcriptional regulator [Rhizobium sp. WW_1]
MQNAKSPKVVALSESVGPQVYRILRERIIQAELLPGERLSESDAAKSLSVSRQPVREAFIKLSEEGLVQVLPQRGTFVTKISVASVMDVRFVREAIEADIVRLVAKGHAADTIAELRRQLAEQRKVSHDDRVGFLRLDELFHHTLAAAAGKSYAWSVIESVKAQMDRVRFLSVDDLHIGRLIEQHEKIVDGIAAGDTAAAEEAMRLHLREILTSLPEIARSRAELFDDTE